MVFDFVAGIPLLASVLLKGHYDKLAGVFLQKQLNLAYLLLQRIECDLFAVCHLDLPLRPHPHVQVSDTCSQLLVNFPLLTFAAPPELV